MLEISVRSERMNNGMQRIDSIIFREHLQPALVDINIETSACERIGIVGRTGAGKSSILSGKKCFLFAKIDKRKLKKIQNFSALVRVAPLSQGRITIGTYRVV